MEINNRKCLRKLIVVAMIALFVSLSCQESYGAILRTIPSTTLKPSTANMLRFSDKNYTAKWNGVAGKTILGTDQSLKMLCVPIKSKSTSFVYRDFLDLTFTNVGRINGRQMDAKVHFNSLTVGKRSGSSQGERRDNYMSVCYLTSWYMWLAGNMEYGAGYRAAKNIDITVTIYWHDTGETVQLPFFQCLQDIDSGAAYYKEGWEAKSGFSGILYKYSTCKLNFSGNKGSTTSDMKLSGSDSLLKGGFYAPTTSGSFRGVFYEGNCATLFSPYSAYSVMKEPLKTSSPSGIFKEGDVINYKVEFNMGNFYSNTMTTYKSLSFEDVLPTGITHNTVRVVDDKGTDLTAQGKITYDEATRKLTFAFNDAWLNDERNYKGQKLILDINAVTNKPEVPLKDILNKANVKVDGIVFLSNEVKNSVGIPYKACYKYVSGTPSRVLPAEISTESGAYSIGDRGEYFAGNIIKRQVAPEEGATYIIKDKKGEKTASWILSWDKVEEKVIDSDVTFTGTWRFVPNPKLIVERKLSYDDYKATAAHGEPTFLYMIKGKKTNESWYRAITFSKIALDNAMKMGSYTDEYGTKFTYKDGHIYGEITVINLPEDEYIVEEIDTLRYETIPDRQMNVNLNLSTFKPDHQVLINGYEKVSFEGGKARWGMLSHCSIKINRLKGER